MELKTRKKTFWEKLSEHSVSKLESFVDYVDVYREWTYYGYLFDEGLLVPLEERGYETVNDDFDHCICGARIYHRYLLVNHITKKYAIIGSECRERFFLPTPRGRRSALAYIIYTLRSQLDYLSKVDGFERVKDEISKLLAIAIYYVEKQTKYGKDLKVSRNFARKVEFYTGLKWRWGVW
jgi:hypothetical protein